MIKGFEPQTKELTPQEEKLVVPILHNYLLQYATGKANAISSIQIIAYLQTRGIFIKGPRVRKLVQYLRDKKILRGLLAGADGYYLSEDPQEIRAYAEESLGSRIRKMIDTKNSILEDADYYESKPLP